MGNTIHPSAVIGPNVTLGEDNIIGPGAVIVGNTVIGDRNWIGPHAVIGTPPEVTGAPHLAWSEPGEGSVRIGNDNVLHEYSNVQVGTAVETTIGDGCFLMTQAHVAHDCIIEDGVTIATTVALGGHCHIWTGANLGMNSTLHQRVVVGPGAMVGMASAVRKEVPAFTITLGNPARTTGINTIGLSRRGCSEDVIAGLTDHLLGRGGVPAGTPDELAALLERWSARETAH